MRFGQLLQQACVDNNSLLCCGLDPDFTKMPKSLQSLAQEPALMTFLQTVVDVTRRHVCAYKLQKAFFDQWDFGHSLLRQLILSIREIAPTVPIIVDSKIGDVENTMMAYLDRLFVDFGVDAALLNPYMGSEVWETLSRYPDKGGIVIVRTSNPSSGMFQNIQLASGKKLWEHVLGSVVASFEAGNDLMPVMSSTAPDDSLLKVRTLVPDEMPIFIAGIGAQGGNIQSIQFCLDSRGRGVVANSSRSILYSFRREDPNWAEGVANAAIELQKELNSLRT